MTKKKDKTRNDTSDVHNEQDSNDDKSKRYHYETKKISLDEGDCAILIKGDKVQFLYNGVEELDELQTAAAGAIVALSNPEWRERLINLIIEESEGSEMRDEYTIEEDEDTMNSSKSLMSYSSIDKSAKDWNIN